LSMPPKSMVSEIMEQAFVQVLTKMLRRLKNIGNRFECTPPAHADLAVSPLQSLPMPSP